mgnify:CR=1 FL=1
MNESSIGEVLRLAREQQGLTLQDVSYALNIKREYLEALEKDEYDAIPGAVSYSGLEKILRALLKEGVPIRDLGLILEAIVDAGPNRDIMPVKKKKIRKDSTKKKKQRQGKWPEITIIAGIIIFLLLIIWILI